MESLEQIWEGLIADVGESLEGIGDDVTSALSEQSAFAAGRAQHLRSMVGQPGFGGALRAELDAVLLKAGLQAAEAGDAVDQRISAVTSTALGALARFAGILAV